ncbi:4Fe-4S cluster-binding domain-containing protein [Bradyrhizobium diazoefficiens]
MTIRISVSRIHFPVTTLGPGRRLGIWFQGCSIRCPGCISMDTWMEGAGKYDGRRSRQFHHSVDIECRRHHHLRRRAFRPTRRSVGTNGTN